MTLRNAIENASTGEAGGCHLTGIALCSSRNLQSATVSLQVVIGLCKRKETAALKIKAAASYARENMSALRRFFSFAVVRQIFTDTFPKAPLLLLVSLFPLQLLRQYSL